MKSGLKGAYGFVLPEGESPFFVLVSSDPVLKAIPVPSMAPSAVGRERHSCDALNRWVRMAVVCSFFFVPDGVIHGQV